MRKIFKRGSHHPKRQEFTLLKNIALLLLNTANLDSSRSSVISPNSDKHRNKKEALLDGVKERKRDYLSFWWLTKYLVYVAPSAPYFYGVKLP